MVLSLQEIEFFFDPLDRVHDIELKRASTGASVASRHLKVRKQLTVDLNFQLESDSENLQGVGLPQQLRLPPPGSTFSPQF